MSLSPREGQLPALMVSSVLYGLNLVTFYLSLQRLLRVRGDWKRGRDINFPMAAVVVLLFLSSTSSLALQLALAMQDNTHLSQSHSDGSHSFQMERRRIGVTQATLLIFETVIVDSVLLFRCWIIWNRMFLAIVLPLTLWVGCLGSSVYAIHCLYFRILMRPKPITLAEKSYPALASFWTCTILVNIYCTGMIVGRICSVQQGWKPPSICSLRDIPQRSRMQIAKRIVIESAMLYTAASLTAFISLICESAAFEFACLAEVQIIGIAFNLILIRPSGPRHDQEYEGELSFRCSKPETIRSTVSVAVGTTDDTLQMHVVERQ